MCRSTTAISSSMLVSPPVLGSRVILPSQILHRRYGKSILIDQVPHIFAAFSLVISSSFQTAVINRSLA
jgi:hypothetical protein